MNVVFWVLVALGVALLWVLLSPLFKTIGDIVIRTAEDVADAMDDESYEEKENDNNEQ